MTICLLENFKAFNSTANFPLQILQRLVRNYIDFGEQNCHGLVRLASK